MSEKPSKNSESQILDERWRKKFEAIGNVDSHLWLECKNQKEEKPKFLSGAIENPRLAYNKLDVQRLTNLKIAFSNLKQEILAEENDPTIREIYDWKINEKISEVKMLLASAHGDMPKFSEYSRAVFGAPDLQIFAHTIESLKNELALVQNSTNPKLVQAAAELEKVLPRFVATEKSELEIPPPTPETFVNLRNAVRTKFKNLLEIVDEGKPKYSSEDLAETFDKALPEIKAKDWESVLDPDKLVISIEDEKNQVSIPTGKSYLVTRVKNLLLHEIGCHIGQITGGRRSRLQLLGIGLDHNMKGFEGIATFAGSLAANPEKFEKYEELDRHLAISLGVGLDGKPRNFREVFEIMQKYYFFQEIKARKDPETAMKNSQNKAWLRCVRTFRGSDCTTRGAIFTKDIVYSEGNIGVWDVFSKNPGLLEKIEIGRFDPTNPRHLIVLAKLQLGISNENLAALEK